MVKFCKILTVGIFILLTSQASNAQFVGVNIDAKTAARITANTAMQVAVEELHNVTLDSIQAVQEKLSFQSMGILSARQKHLNSQKDASGFDVETPFYRTIFNLATDIVARAPVVVGKITKAPLSGKVSMLLEVENMVADCIQLTNDFRNIVTNCKVKPILDSQYTKEQKDGLNLLDRDERVGMAVKIIASLSKIQVKLMRMGYYADYAAWSDVMYAIDRETWCNVIYGKSIATKLTSEWNALSK